MNRYFQNFVRRLLGRGRQRRYFVTPPVRLVRKLFEKHPIAMNGLCYGTLCASAELSQQTIKHYVAKSQKQQKVVKKYDFTAVKRLAIWGTFVIPPIYHNWYKWLENRFPPCSITGVISKQDIIKKTIFDQFIFTPPLLILFFGGMALVEYAKDNELWNHVKNEITVKLPPVYLADCAFWIPVQAFNFAFVPPTWRVLYIGLMSFIWLNFLCFVRSIKSDEDDNKEPK